MLTFLMFSRHTPAECSTHNAKNRKATLEAFSKGEELAKKHGVNVVGMWNVHPEHLVVQVLEAPSMEAFIAYSMEPPFMKLVDFTTTEWKLATTGEDMMKNMMQAEAQ